LTAECPDGAEGPVRLATFNFKKPDWSLPLWSGLFAGMFRFFE